MLFVKLLDIYNKINSCPRKMGSLQVLCALGDAHRQGVEWMPVGDLANATQADISNVRTAIGQMVKENLLEKRYLDLQGQVTERATKSPVVRLVPECVQALGGDCESYA